MLLRLQCYAEVCYFQRQMILIIVTAERNRK